MASAALHRRTATAAAAGLHLAPARALAQTGLPRRTHAHDRLRLPVRAVRLHPAGRLPPRLPDARGPDRRSPTASPTTTRCACSTASRTTCSRSAATPPGVSAGRSRSLAAVFGLLAAVRALRTEEDTGRMELVLAGCVGRGTAFLSRDGGDRGGHRDPVGSRSSRASSRAASRVGGSAYLALATASVMPVFVGIGALVSQLAPTRRVALELGSAVGGAVLAAARGRRHRRAASAGCAGRRRSGWAEELRPFAGPRALVLLLPVSATVCCWRSPRGSPRAATSAPACSRRATAPSRACACCPRRPRRRCAASAAAWSCGLSSIGVFALHPRRWSRRASPPPGSPRASSERSRSSARARSSRRPATSRSCSSSSSSPSACSRARRSAPPGARRPSEQLETLLALPVEPPPLARRAAAARRRRRAAAISLVAGPAHLGGRRLAGRRRLAGADARGRAPTACRSRSCSWGSPRSPTRSCRRRAPASPTGS